MMPTIQVGDTCIVDQYSSAPIERFDIVMFNAPEWAKKTVGKQNEAKYIKRIIGLPGEKIEIKSNKIYINDKLSDEPFEKIIDNSDKGKDFPPTKIPEGEYFLLGDNRPESLDSRYWKPTTIKQKEILGKVIQIIPDAK